jgi:hypothetical protein
MLFRTSLEESWNVDQVTDAMDKLQGLGVIDYNYNMNYADCNKINRHDPENFPGITREDLFAECDSLYHQSQAYKENLRQHLVSVMKQAMTNTLQNEVFSPVMSHAAHLAYNDVSEKINGYFKDKKSAKEKQAAAKTELQKPEVVIKAQEEADAAKPDAAQDAGPKENKKDNKFNFLTNGATPGIIVEPLTMREFKPYSVDEPSIPDHGSCAESAPENTMQLGYIRELTHKTGKIMMQGEEAVGEGLKWTWNQLEENAPKTAGTIKEYANVAGGYIGRGVEFAGEYVPDSVKEKYNQFLENTTPEERTFWEYVVGFGAATKLGYGLKKIGKFDKVDAPERFGILDHELYSFKSADSLKIKLSKEQVSSMFDSNGVLRSEFINQAIEVPLRKGIRNAKVIDILTSDGSNINEWAKFTTKTINSGGIEGEFHFYKNKVTGKINKDIDYKFKFK